VTAAAAAAGSEARDGFVPPVPPRIAGRLPPLELLRRFRRNMLEVWHERHFEKEFFETRLLARRVFVCNSPETAHAAFVAQNDAFERKTPQQRHALEPLIGDGLFISDGMAWRARRRVVAGATHVSRLAELASAMTAAVEERRAAWAALPPGGPVDVAAEMGGLAAEVICRTLFGRSLGAEGTAEAVGGFGRYLRRVAGEDLPSLLGLPDWVPRFQRLRVGGEVRRIHAVLDRLVAEALAAPSPSLVRAMAEGGGLPRAALRDEVATLFLAGHETTANAMAWAWALLDGAPGAAVRLRAEARAALGGGRAAGVGDLPRLPFARAVVEEAMRLYPPVPILAREAQREAEIAGRRIPRGALVLVVPWLLHRHRRLWDRPDHFLPEWFLPGAPPRPRHAFLPFSLGPRVCTGAHFAMAEAVIALATLSRDVAPRMAPGAPPVVPVARLTLRPGEGLPMLLERAPA
jgi:cytochrome P450